MIKSFNTGCFIRPLKLLSKGFWRDHWGFYLLFSGADACEIQRNWPKKRVDIFCEFCAFFQFVEFPFYFFWIFSSGWNMRCWKLEVSWTHKQVNKRDGKHKNMRFNFSKNMCLEELVLLHLKFSFSMSRSCPRTPPELIWLNSVDWNQQKDNRTVWMFRIFVSGWRIWLFSSANLKFTDKNMFFAIIL